MRRQVRTIESAELVVDARAGLGEGPVWEPESGRLIWLELVDWWNKADDATGVVHLHDPESGAGRSIEVAGGVGSVALRSAGGLAVAAGGRIRDSRSRIRELPDGRSPGSRRGRAPLQ